ncbi:MAG: hypothetical protein JO112_16150 [Planctomycetes bacterium]|nr:hypothetical protein [Planctomycetota bacterium]
MSEHLTIPTPDEIRARIRACRQEMACLRRLLRVSVATVQTEEARKRRLAVAPPRRPAGGTCFGR